MKPSTLEWIKKAESDFQAALALARRRKIPLHDVRRYHAGGAPSRRSAGGGSAWARGLSGHEGAQSFGFGHLLGCDYGEVA